MVRDSYSVIEVTTRLPSVPLNFANELPSKRTVIVLLAPSWTCSRFVDRNPGRGYARRGPAASVPTVHWDQPGRRGAHNPMRIGE